MTYYITHYDSLFITYIWVIQYDSSFYVPLMYFQPNRLSPEENQTSVNNIIPY